MYLLMSNNLFSLLTTLHCTAVVCSENVHLSLMATSLYVQKKKKKMLFKLILYHIGVVGGVP